MVTCSKPLVDLLDKVSDKQGTWAIINVLGFKVGLVLRVDGKRTGTETGMVGTDNSKSNIAFPMIPCPCPATKIKGIMAGVNHTMGCLINTPNGSATPLDLGGHWVSVIVGSCGLDGFKPGVSAFPEMGKMPADAKFSKSHDVGLYPIQKGANRVIFGIMRGEWEAINVLKNDSQLVCFELQIPQLACK